MKSEMTAVNALTILAVLLMPLVFHGTRITAVNWMPLATAYTLLYSVWSSFRWIEKRSQSFESSLTSDQQPQFQRIRNQVGYMCLAAIGGIAMAFGGGRSIAAHF